jgi:hypothetical protein
VSSFYTCQNQFVYLLSRGGNFRTHAQLRQAGAETGGDREGPVETCAETGRDRRAAWCPSRLWTASPRLLLGPCAGSETGETDDFQTTALSEAARTRDGCCLQSEGAAGLVENEWAALAGLGALQVDIQSPRGWV